ncbi:MAG: DegT/DnrJ/EryC1/StrS family aminotransferase [Acidobacteria bacterium]|nr:DegT/DnrJ/EryC1/StrS family aminotransferase [Acidobacteriota bacterium]
MRIPLIDLQVQYLNLRTEIDEAIRRVVQSGQFILGEEVERFEEEFAGYCGVRFGVGTSSGSAALHAGLLALGVGPGDEVITTPMTYFATSAEVSHAGARPVFADVARDTLNLDPGRVEELIESRYSWHESGSYLVNRRTRGRLKALVPVHLFGQVAEMEPLTSIANRYRLALLEDAAQAHGAGYLSGDKEWLRAGQFGQLACFSFYPSKNLGAFGDAGMIVTNDLLLRERLRRWVNQGRRDRYVHEFEGYNYRLDALQAAVLRAKLPHLDEWNEARRRAAAAYEERLKGVGDLRTPGARPDAQHVYHVYAVRTAHRDGLLAALQESGIGAAIHYPMPLHLQPAHSGLGYRGGDFPVAETACREILSLPMFPEITEPQIDHVTEVTRKFFDHLPMHVG